MTVHAIKLCKRCNETKTKEEFYRRRTGKDLSPYCKICSNQQTVERQRKFKQKCVEYKGGKCERCGYDTYLGALEFHHKDPSGKDFSVSKARLTTFNENIEKELDKCSCLCANCHREEHAKVKGLL